MTGMLVVINDMMHQIIRSSLVGYPTYTMDPTIEGSENCKDDNAGVPIFLRLQGIENGYVFAIATDDTSGNNAEDTREYEEDDGDWDDEKRSKTRRTRGRTKSAGRMKNHPKRKWERDFPSNTFLSLVPTTPLMKGVTL